MYSSRKKLFGQALRLLAVGSLMLLATVVLKYTSWECEFNDLGEDTKDPRTQRCKDQLYQSLRLSPKNEANCSLITRGDASTVQETLLRRLQQKNQRVSLNEKDYLDLTQNCGLFKESRRFVQFPLSKEEEDFPVAYSMVIHEKIEMFERLLRSIYAPQNIYCVHVDRKAPDAFKEAVRAIASCFENVFVASRLEEVVYASWSRVQADLNCMGDLLASKVRWRYLLNTCGTDFPIKTNAEIVRALKALNLQNNMESERPSSGKMLRWKYRHEVTDSVSRTDTEKSPPPHSIQMFTGSAYIVVTREFVQHILEDPIAKEFLEWSKDTYSPDEHLWATLHRMPGIPGSVPANDKYDLTDMNAIARVVKWSYLEGDMAKGAPYPPCTGVSRRAVCVYGVGDLQWMLAQHHLLANKFDPTVDEYALQCLEEYLRYKAIYGKVL
ncbi:beta-1,3-galactosyl-O-glycosyl-glycoprotein beta-1,6-N-acetylglucosaminyltransferase 3 [Sphaerodactylus townsendi]|uniref:Beta-1,3-galactosyl-O-glycosyl-glycoprotein beta-1,6-N-acetylglucosaminyltransferase n=1 Tax=Sphaerodactylus townsendi TaxID=933632 RepID=A0ACB8E5C0_9SAUR|nr:beta-1,3-galactosyl-O-glycosyl-glycoprotein beta-1,6-N-acetylglucosaminyltransferase 3 [Sphaerodactylus townsendi]